MGGNHIRPQQDFVSELTQVVRFEEAWQAQLRECYGLEGEPPRLQKGAVSAVDWAELLDVDRCQRVLEFYRPDFEALGYALPEAIPVAGGR